MKRAISRGLCVAAGTCGAVYATKRVTLAKYNVVEGAPYPNMTGYEIVEPGGVSAIRNYGSPLADEIAEKITKRIFSEDDWAPTMLRLAWHACGTYCKKSDTGGSDGGGIRNCPESTYGANAGLHKARAKLESIKRDYPHVSYADIYVLAGIAAIKHLGGPEIPFRFGRKDFRSAKNKPVPDGRLPAADSGDDSKNIQHIRDIFQRMGFDDRETVALLGAHAVGFCHKNASGYDGPWTNSPYMFSNDFFVTLKKEEWTPKEWDGPLQYTDGTTSKLMMLPTDLALLKDQEFKKLVDEFADDEEAWTTTFQQAFLKLTELGVAAFKDFPYTEAQKGPKIAPTYWDINSPPNVQESLKSMADIKNVFPGKLKADGRNAIVLEMNDGRWLAFPGYQVNRGLRYMVPNYITKLYYYADLHNMPKSRPLYYFDEESDADKMGIEISEDDWDYIPDFAHAPQSPNPQADVENANVYDVQRWGSEKVNGKPTYTYS